MKLEKLGIPAAVSIQFLGPASLVVERAVVPTAKTMDITDNSSFKIMKPIIFIEDFIDNFFDHILKEHQGHEHTPTVPPYSLRTTAIFWRRTVMTPVAALTPASPKTVVAASVKSAVAPIKIRGIGTFQGERVVVEVSAMEKKADKPRSAAKIKPCSLKTRSCRSTLLSPAPPAFSAIADLDYCTAFSPLRYGFGYGWYGLGMQVSEVDAPERNELIYSREPENSQTVNFFEKPTSGAKNRSNLRLVAKKNFRKNNFSFFKKFAYMQKKKKNSCICTCFKILFQKRSNT
ncbi:hypothetical protein LXL04_004434 [Taraxacum kok-saghyz]